MNLDCDPTNPDFDFPGGPACYYDQNDGSTNHVRHDGALVALSAEDGHQKWVLPFRDIHLDGGAVMHASKPVVSHDDSTVYLQSYHYGGDPSHGSGDVVLAVSSGYRLEKGFWGIPNDVFMIICLFLIGVGATLLVIFVVLSCIAWRSACKKGNEGEYDNSDDRGHAASGEGSEGLLGGGPIVGGGSTKSENFDEITSMCSP